MSKFSDILEPTFNIVSGETDEKLLYKIDSCLNFYDLEITRTEKGNYKINKIKK